MVLIIANVARESIEALSHLEDTRSLSKLAPEVLRDLRDSVDSDTVKTVSLNKIFNPVLKLLSNITIFLFQVRKA